MDQVTIDFSNKAIYEEAYETMRCKYNIKNIPQYGDFAYTDYKGFTLYEEYFRNRGEYMQAKGDCISLGGKVRQ